MSLTADLVHIVETVHSLARILDEAVRAIAERFHVDACSAFVLDERGRLVRAAASGADVLGTGDGAEAEPVAARALAERRSSVLHGQHRPCSCLR